MTHTRRYILLLLLVITQMITAQNRLSTPEIFLGVHGGVKASTVLFNPSVQPLDILHSPLSPNGGLVFRYAEHRVCALQVECNYMQRGWAEVYEKQGAVPTIYTRQLHYIELPFLMHIALGKKNFRLFFNLGPQIGYCFGEETKVTNPGSYQFTQEQHNEITNRFDWGAAAGLGCYYRSNRIGVFQLEARFDYSLGALFDVGQLQHFKMASPMGLSVNVGYLWEFKNSKNKYK